MRENMVEKHLVRKVKEMGGKAYKFVSPGNAGVPDRLVCFPGGKIIFVELKAPGKEPRPLQQARISELIKFGCAVCVADSKLAVDMLLEPYVK